MAETLAARREPGLTVKVILASPRQRISRQQHLRSERVSAVLLLAAFSSETARRYQHRAVSDQSPGRGPRNHGYANN